MVRVWLSVNLKRHGVDCGGTVGRIGPWTRADRSRTWPHLGHNLDTEGQTHSTLCAARARLAGWRWRRFGRRWRWFGRRWRSEQWHGDWRQPRNLHDRRADLRGSAWSGWLANRRPLHWTWRRCRRDAVADVDSDDRPRNGLTARRRANHGTIRR